MTDTIETLPLSSRALRHEVRDLLTSTSLTDLNAFVAERLSGRVGMSFREQRAAAQEAKTAIEEADDEDYQSTLQEAVNRLDSLLSLIDAREAEANKPEDPATFLTRLLAQAEVGLQRAVATRESLAVAEVSATEALTVWNTIKVELQAQVDALSE
jgi:hypothetical protein